ncbi:MAG: type II toxin-antitoxin system mRNA interferase toxin, RelE/StbE family [Dethiosulfovibrio peptidovorans]|nr:MAG: type II toxin-antitoxin system mRNA interferase toxin, RelE/StbE family [Dethiosulfovibrio peptidovorans]
MSYKIEIFSSAAKQLRKLDGITYSRIRSAVDPLSEASRPKGCAILKVEKRYRIRVGDYRIIYEVHDNKP